MSDIEPVALFLPDYNPYLHLIEYHNIVLLPGTPYDVLVKVHQAHHFAIGMGRAEPRIRHYHSDTHTKALAKALSVSFDHLLA